MRVKMAEQQPFENGLRRLTKGRPMIDTMFNFGSDSGGRDPDQYSPTLRRYHQVLWSKALPDGSIFTLDQDTRDSYLHHRSKMGDHFLASDAITHSYRDAYGSRIGAVIAQVPPSHVTEVFDAGSTIGAYILFPGYARDGKQTINGARGFHPSICDRFDLTLECIRRHYAGEDSKLAAPLARYADFFDLFGDFNTYVDFWLLNDLIDENTSAIHWFLPFDDFVRSPLPRTVEEYESYRQAVLSFVKSRGTRITEWAAHSGA